jgi:hypothetical protein
MRPRKSGLDYFPHDTDAVNDDKLQSLMAIHGTDGYAFYFIMLERIFRTENGRITIGTQSEKAGLAKVIGISLKKFEAILTTAVEVKCFCPDVFRMENSLTSTGIQKRLETVKHLREKERIRKDNTKDKYKRKTKHGKPTENSKYLELFNNLWERYPNKDGKKEAIQHFQATVLCDTDADNIQKALSNYLQSEKVKTGYIKNGSTWFNNWKDWINWVEIPKRKESSQFEPSSPSVLDKIKAAQKEATNG